jgi:hypothetical protein
MGGITSIPHSVVCPRCGNAVTLPEWSESVGMYHSNGAGMTARDAKHHTRHSALHHKSDGCPLWVKRRHVPRKRSCPL